MEQRKESLGNMGEFGHGFARAVSQVLGIGLATCEESMRVNSRDDSEIWTIPTDIGDISIGNNESGSYIHWDIDVLDPALMGDQHDLDGLSAALGVSFILKSDSIALVSGTLPPEGLKSSAILKSWTKNALLVLFVLSGEIPGKGVGPIEMYHRMANKVG